MNSETIKTKTKWALDSTHSEVLFKVKHLMITNVKGEFRTFNAELELEEENLENAKLEVNIDASSIFTNNEDRDKHLKSADFFDADNHQNLNFKSSIFTKLNDSTYKVTGILSIKNISKEISLNVDFGGFAKDPWGNEKVGFSISGKLNRKEWGLTWNAPLEAGCVLVGDEINISAEAQFAKA